MILRKVFKLIIKNNKQYYIVAGLQRMFSTSIKLLKSFHNNINSFTLLGLTQENNKNSSEIFINI